jgi:hypothetical protein
MWKNISFIIWITGCHMIFNQTGFPSSHYQNFRVAVYSRAYETQEMKDLNWLKPRWDNITRQVKVDKIYLETHRDLLLVDEKTIAQAKYFFENQGVQTAGGITLTINERNRFETFCYTNPEHRQRVKEIIEYTAGFFDEIILDDFFFTNCKCEKCITAKGNKSWTEFRLELMKNAAKNLILDPAKTINPNVRVVIKYPNWYEHFQGLGFNLEAEPPMFDGIYTGTETRDPSSNQHLQQYLSYLNFRYLENLKPGSNGGGWVDTGGIQYLDRYAEQLWLTLFAKAPEITLFDFRQLQRKVKPELRAEWQDQGSSFNFDEMLKPVRLSDGSWPEETTMALVAGYTLEQIDGFLNLLGNPIGIKSYKPFHSVGEDFLQNYLGMIGIPMDIVPEFPTEERMIVLTETAKYDPKIVQKIKNQLVKGSNILITSGLLRALQGTGIEDVVELRYTDRKAIVKDFRIGRSPYLSAAKEMVIPQIQYLTNDSWEEISAMDETNGWPLLHSAGYSKGTLYLLTVPESYTNLYNLPVNVLSRIKEIVMKNFFVRVESPGRVALFVYDNDTFIVESFRPESVEVNIITKDRINKLVNIITNEVITGTERTGWQGQKMGEKQFVTTLKPHSYCVFRGE